MELRLIPIKKPDDVNIIIGQAHFIKTVEDIHELMVTSIPGVKFGLAFCEASGPRLVRRTGTDTGLVRIAVRSAVVVGAGHAFYLVLRGAYPINILPRLKQVPEVVAIYCATSNPVKLVVADTESGRAILGVVDGGSPVGVEQAKDKRERVRFLRKIGYKL